MSIYKVACKTDHFPLQITLFGWGERSWNKIRLRQIAKHIKKAIIH